MKVQKFIEIRLLKKRIIPVVDLVQYDTGIQLVFSLVDFDIPSGTSATLYVQKRSGKFVFQEEGITVSGNTITIDLENQALTEHGETKYQITLKNGTDTVTTFAGVLRIEKSLADANAVESKTVVRAFDEAVADHVAEFRDKAEQIVAACIETIPEDYTVMEAKVNELANAVKGNMSGAVVFADDVSPVEHEPSVWVHGKNLIPYPYEVNTQTINGITYTDNGNGSFTLNGTSTANFAIVFLNSIELKLKGKYTFSMGNKFDGAGGIYLKNSAEKTILFVAAGNTSQTVEVNDTITRFDLWINSGKTFDNFTVYPQLEQNDSATAYEPYIDPSTITVSRHGKNLAYGSTSQTYTNKGLTITRTEGSSEFVLNGTTEATFSYVPTKRITLLPGTYTVSVYGLNTVSSNVDRCFVYDATNSKVLVNSIMTNKPKSFTLDSCVQVWIEVVFAESTTYSNTRIKLQMEYGSEATEYEKCKEVADFVPNSDGTISGLTSVSPNMTILTDTEGVIVECEYNRDTNKVIEKLTNAIIALGGTV